MAFSQNDLEAINGILAPVLGREAWDAHIGYGARISINFGEARVSTRGRWTSTDGEWVFWIDTCAWRIEDQNGVLSAWEDPDPIIKKAVERLNGRALLGVDISPVNADTVLRFADGLLLRLFPIYMDPQGDEEHWHLFSWSDALTLGPGTSWSYKPSDAGLSRKRSDDPAIGRYEAACPADAWPCRLDSAMLQHAGRDAVAGVDLLIRLTPQGSQDGRRFALTFHGVQHLTLAVPDAQTPVQQLFIEEAGERAWDDIAYYVHDPGEFSFGFYCSSFDVTIEAL
jgi:hypothetical protein